MITPEEIRKTASRRLDAYEKHLARILAGETDEFTFPVRLAGRQSGGTVADATALVQGSIQNKRNGWTICWETRTDRYGNESHIMKAIVAETPVNLAEIAGRREAFLRYRRTLEQVAGAFPDKAREVGLWAQTADIRKALEADVGTTYWADIIMITKWAVSRTVRDDIYIREVPLPVDTKFLERESGILAGLYAVLTNTDIPEGNHRLEKLYGLKVSPAFVRYRLYGEEERSVTVQTFRNLDAETNLSDTGRIFVIENLAVYLSFPLEKEDMCVFGGGFASASAKGAEWMENRRILYYGDLDEYGLMILSLFRGMFPKTESFLMDVVTYDAWRQFSVPGTRPKSTDAYRNLTKSELELLAILESNPEHSRLEQEKIPYTYIRRSLEKLNAKD